ncbi:uncharacterized protein TERG_00273 [Trichophyton rubrum CBS 118892]|uniref:Uncharacterized protein n=1 Tax=Trichophyton rubrum (strain ATCC MYA-4607 / CBS 118892) TaxID=559305 RepID=F2SEV4_TRIRC|nr:uncharacterized protein TERG_00273 [Trichophyton rubrum CBS 118892]EGD83993.2 hypothetical protein TERG_00273 [Trichophyton rubrum CBS 118892]
MMASDSFAPSSLPLRQQQHSHSHGHRISHNHRAASPPLEGDEREFTLTASMVRERTTGDDGQAGKLRGLLLDSPPASLDLQVDDMDASPYLDGQAASDQGEYGHHQYDDYFSRPIDIPTTTTLNSTSQLRCLLRSVASPGGGGGWRIRTDEQLDYGPSRPVQFE